MSANNEELLQPETPVKFASRNMRPSFRRLKRAGDIFLIEIEVEEPVWDSMRTVPDDAIWEHLAWWHYGDSEAEDARPEKESKGPHRDFWHYLFKHGFQNFPDLIQVLGCAGDQIRLRLHDVFEVESLSNVSPDQFEDWLRSENLTSLITLSRQARAKLAEAA